MWSSPAWREIPMRATERGSRNSLLSATEFIACGSLEYGGHHLLDATLDLGVVGEGPDHSHLAGTAG